MQSISTQQNFIDDICAINDDMELRRFSFNIYPKEHELEGDRHGVHAIFLNLNITIKEKTFLYKFFDKKIVSLSNHCTKNEVFHEGFVQ